MLIKRQKRNANTSRVTIIAPDQLLCTLDALVSVKKMSRSAIIVELLEDALFNRLDNNLGHDQYDRYEPVRTREERQVEINRAKIDAEVNKDYAVVLAQLKQENNS